MNDFKDFIKYNPHLIHLDLKQTGLTVEAIKQFGTILTRAQSLRCLHLCGNDGVNDETIEYLLQRIKGKKPTVPNLILPPKKTLIQIRAEAAVAASQVDNDKQDIFKLFGKSKNSEQADDPNVQWKNIRAGLKLRNIVQSKRMNELGLQSGIKESKLII